MDTCNVRKFEYLEIEFKHGEESHWVALLGGQVGNFGAQFIEDELFETEEPTREWTEALDMRLSIEQRIASLYNNEIKLEEYSSAFLSRLLDNWIIMLFYKGSVRNDIERILSKRTGYVYVLKAGPFYKIGRSINVDNRVKQLATLPPFDIEIMHTIPTNDMQLLESFLHSMFDRERKNGEWFELSEESVEIIFQLRSHKTPWEWATADLHYLLRQQQFSNLSWEDPLKNNRNGQIPLWTMNPPTYLGYEKPNT